MTADATPPSPPTAAGRVVWKYPLQLDATVLNLPEGSKAVGVGLDPQRHACVWIELDPRVPNTMVHEYVVVGTGHEVPEGGTHIGHILLEHLGLVLHVYELEVF